jgi:hypothetical protein
MEKVIQRGSYTLLIGNNSIDLFDYFMVDELHGLNRTEANAFTDTKDSAYIAGMANYHPLDKNLTMLFKPFLFLNKKRLNGTYTDVTLLLHEYMHLGRILGNGIDDSNEEGIVTWIEKEINFLINEGIVGIFQQPATRMM